MVQILRYLGIGKETTFGEAVAGTVFVDPTACTLDSPQGYEMSVPGGMGRMRARKRPGFYVCSGGIEYPVDVLSLGYLLRGALDMYVFTAGTPNNTHEFYGGNNNEPESWTYRVGKDVFEQIFTGTVINTLTLSVVDGFANASLDLFARKDDPGTLKSYSDFASLVPSEYPLIFHEVTATINNVDSSAICRSVNLSINNNIVRDSGRSIGDMYPATFKSNERVAELTLELQFNDLTHRTLFWGDEDGPICTGSTLFPLTLEFDGGDYGEMIVYLPNCQMISNPIQSRGKDTIYQTITVQGLQGDDVALADASTVDTDILVTLLNSGATLE